ncbi:DUF397 domain-containing protein [Streptomyces sp. SAI-208]|uniref:DUF397 domain-containing protein n=1 Tax=Streptomyces sp. SAI-208 TaxID=2940550 RepID=UPI002475D073|nr:DUF397 domain-containing protein [Streptomyces sp. SAI-208]
MAIRDSKTPTQATLSFPAEFFATFIRGLKTRTHSTAIDSPRRTDPPHPSGLGQFTHGHPCGGRATEIRDRPGNPSGTPSGRDVWSHHARWGVWAVLGDYC